MECGAITNNDDEKKEQEQALNYKKVKTWKESKNDAWINLQVDLTEIDTKNQTFSIHCWINVFWVDETFVDGDFRDKVSQSNKHIHAMGYNDFIQNFGTYRLPLNVNKLFLNGISTDIKPDDAWKIWINPQTKDLHIFLEWKGTCYEHLECDDFPFDAQFLNIKIFYDTRNYNFVTDCPYYVYLASDFAYHLPIKVTKFGSIVQWEMLSPWIDLSNRDHKRYFYESDNNVPKFDYGLIKLRVQREPYYYLLYTVFPLILIVGTSFAVSAIAPEDIGDRLGYLVTLLLTIAAFQYAISGELPDSPTLTNVDKFILSGYFIECLFIIYVAISATAVTSNEYQYVVSNIELILPMILGCFWLSCIVLFVCYPYYKYKKGVNWQQMCDNEYHEFDVNNDKNTSIQVMKENDLFLGSETGGYVNGTKQLYCEYIDKRHNGKRQLQIKQINFESTYTQLTKDWKEFVQHPNPNEIVQPRPYDELVLTTTARKTKTE